MQIPHFSKPSKDCYLTTDKNGTQLKAGDILQSTTRTVIGDQLRTERYQPVTEHNGHLIIPHAGSYLVECFVISKCEIVKP